MSDDFDRHAARYDAWFERPRGKALFESEILCLRSLTQALEKPVLEVGVGTGRFAEALGVDVGVDPAGQALARAAKRGITVTTAVGEHLPFADHSFGGVLLVITICFLRDPLAALTECHRVLMSGGKAVFGFVPRDGPWGQHYLRRKGRGDLFYSSAAFYSYEEVVALSEQAGLTVVRVRSTLFQKPEQEHFFIEEPREGYFAKAGFLGIQCVVRETR